jgi:hypothetical protein
VFSDSPAFRARLTAKGGKTAALMVVANAELAQSYIVQALITRRYRRSASLRVADRFWLIAMIRTTHGNGVCAETVQPCQLIGNG